MSWTISAPSARTPSRRVRRRAIGFSRAPLRCPASSVSSSAGGAAGRAGFLQLEPGLPRRQLQLPETLAVLEAMAKRHAPAREPVVEGVVVGRDEEPRLDRLAAELGQREVLAGTKLHLSLAGLADRHPPSLGAVTR